MNLPAWLSVGDEVRNALSESRPVVALESTLIAHGLPWPVNLETAQAAEDAVRQAGAVPATIAVWQGRPTIGLSPKNLQALAQAHGVLKASRRDLPTAIVLRRTAATTVAATMSLARRPWTSANLRRALWRFPLMTHQVAAAIYWQALQLWWNGATYYPHSTLPANISQPQETIADVAVVQELLSRAHTSAPAEHCQEAEWVVAAFLRLLIRCVHHSREVSAKLAVRVGHRPLRQGFHRITADRPGRGGGEQRQRVPLRSRRRSAGACSDHASQQDA